MPNTIMTQEVAETIAATTAQNIPLLGKRRINQELSSKLVAGNGDIVNVLIPGFGEVSEGPSFVGIEDQLNIKVDSQPVQVSIKKMGAAYDLLEKTLKLNTFKSQVAEPYGAKLASYVNTDIFKTILGAAHSSIVSQTSFNDLAEAVAYVESTRVGDEISGMLSPISKATVIGTGANKFAHTSIGEKLYKGEIGEFSGAEFFSSPDAGSLKVGTGAGVNSFAFTATAAAVNEGATSISLTGITQPTGSAAITVIPAGTPIIFSASTSGTITSDVNVADVFGNDTGLIRTFVATADAPVTSGAATIQITPVHFTAGANTFAVPNTYANGNDSIASGPVVCPLFYGVKYYKGTVFASKAATVASVTPKPFGGNADSVSFEMDGELGVRVSTIPGFMSGQDRWRMDIIYGVAALYGAGAVAVYTQAV